MSDPILFWNNVALEANRVSHSNGQGEQTGPTLSSRALAIVHLAMYEAFAGITNNPAKLPLYLGTVPAPNPASSIDVAVGAAAFVTLKTLFPSQEPFFKTIFDALGMAGTPSYDGGKSYGEAVAAAVIADRMDDPDAGTNGYKPKDAPGKHRPDPDNAGQGFHGPVYGALSKGFGITQRHELDVPPFRDAEYDAAVLQVLGKGIKPELMGTLDPSISKRTSNEALIGTFWAYDGASGLGTPPRLYNQIIREVAVAKGNLPEDNARLFAFVNVAMADAGILSWDQKYIHEFWRPVVGIREHDESMGPQGPIPTDTLADLCDPFWLPLGAPNTNRIAKNFTPPFPAYPSGHATFGAAAFHIARMFYGVKPKDTQPDNLADGLSFVSEEFNGVSTDNQGTVRPRHNRSFPGGLWQMIVENGESRVFLGVHWVFDAFALASDGRTPDLARRIGGVPLGLAIAEDVFAAGGGLAPKKSSVGPRVAAPVKGGGERFSSSYSPAASAK